MNVIGQYFVVAVVLRLNLCSNGQYYLYGDDCLDFYAADYTRPDIIARKQARQEHQVIPYCRRNHFIANDQMIIPAKEITSWRFDELNKRNISSQQLYKWSAHLDLVESYQAFRENRTDNEIDEAQTIFYNCSLKQKFGRYCQYSLDVQRPFQTILKDVFKKTYSLPSNGTCYVHLNCLRNNVSWCLDWSDVCDGKPDCWPDIIDEQHCEQLERNECAEDEYRCVNGQCIPEIFLLDETYVPDCLDGTDEQLSAHQNFQKHCWTDGDPSFYCTDIKCLHWSFSLGPASNRHCDSSYYRDARVRQFPHDLLSLTINKHIQEECWATMICLLQINSGVISLDNPSYSYLFNGSCNNVCREPSIPCAPRLEQYCPPLFEFPAMSINGYQLHFLYSWNRSNILPGRPNYICYDERHCGTSQSNIKFEKLSQPSIILSCQHQNISNFPIGWSAQILSIQRYIYQRCSLMANEQESVCLETNQFRCGNKCISKHRLLDDLADCPDNIDERYNESCSLMHKHRLTCYSNFTGIERTYCQPRTRIRQGRLNECNAKIKLPRFPNLCDKNMEYEEVIGKQKETDETNCEEWQCDNQYTRCDGVWECDNGADEAKCFNPICKGKEGHPCFLINTTKFVCLPVEYANDGIVDCLGATDERHSCKSLADNSLYLCRANGTNKTQGTFKEKACISRAHLCDGNRDCLLGDDEDPFLCKHS
ncbi:unnamed protein product, partial [Adineta ricciae]